MFKRIVNYKGFWKSVLVLSIVYAIAIYVIQWGLEGNWMGILDARPIVILVFLLTSFIVGFMVTYGKFWRKLKEQDYRK